MAGGLGDVQVSYSSLSSWIEPVGAWTVMFSGVAPVTELRLIRGQDAVSTLSGWLRSDDPRK